MNNQQFRNLLLSNARKDGSAGSPPTTARPSATPALGSRKHSSIPMTPRQVGRNSVTSEFARQLAERNAKSNPAKRFKSSAPKGVKLAAGYTDRTKTRVEEEEDDKAKRIKALEESMKLQQIDRETFEKLVLEITDGDINSTHLVKGLDRKLLARIRKGEDVLGVTDEREGQDSDVEDEFDELAEQEIGPVVKEKVEKKGEMAPPPPVAGVKGTRDAILAELKAQRKAAAEAAAAEHAKKYPALGPRFRKIGPNGETTRLEVDSKGREVLIITDADGKEKRKVRKQKVEEPQLEVRQDLMDDSKLNLRNIPEATPEAKMEVKPEEESEEDEDIFAGVGANYNPLAGLEDDDSSEDEADEKPSTVPKVDSEDTEEPISKSPVPVPVPKETSEDEDVPSEHASPQPTTSKEPSAPIPRRNYFNDTPSAPTAKETADATVRAALAKVRTMDPDSALLQDTEEARLRKRAAELAKDRDMEDLDMGFGESRFGDADEMEREGEKTKFSRWKGLGADDDDDDDDEEGGQGGKGGKKRKRGGKKKKGDKNSAADVMQVMERQKGSKTLG